MAGNFVRGIQSEHVIGDLKHFAVNDQESGRNSLNANISRRAMRETDLRAFEIALRISHAGAIMCAYNRVNGEFACENSYLLTEVDTPHFPPDWISHGRAHKDAFRVLQQSNLDWTSLSPAAMIQPGERTGRFRLSGGSFMADQSGQSSISAEDFAIALVDELERPRHVRQLLGVVY